MHRGQRENGKREAGLGYTSSVDHVKDIGLNCKSPGNPLKHFKQEVI